MVVLSLCRPGTTEKTARERARPAQEREEQRTVSRERAEVREEEEVNTPLMSINTAKLVRWLQEHLPTGEKVKGQLTILPGTWCFQAGFLQWYNLYCSTLGHLSPRKRIQPHWHAGPEI